MNSAQRPGDIRAAHPQDRGAMLELARSSGLFPPDGIADVEALLDAFFAGAASDDRWLVGSRGDRVAGIAYYAPERMTDGTWNLYLLVVHRQHQGQGLGAALVRRVEQDLGRTGARILLIETSGVPAFDGQRALYAGLDYHEEARVREFYGPGDDKIIYWKQLPGAGPSPPPNEQLIFA